jgi:hypothetical protein
LEYLATAKHALSAECTALPNSSLFISKVLLLDSF